MRHCPNASATCYDLLTWNQSIVQQLTMEGNLRRRLRKASPMGDMASTTWSWSRTRWMNRLNKATGDPSVCLVLSLCLQNNTIVKNFLLLLTLFIPFALFSQGSAEQEGQKAFDVTPSNQYALRLFLLFWVDMKWDVLAVPTYPIVSSFHRFPAFHQWRRGSALHQRSASCWCLREKTLVWSAKGDNLINSLIDWLNWTMHMSIQYKQ